MSAKPGLDLDDAHWMLVKDILYKHIPDREVWAFGSRVHGTAKKLSDLDLAVMGAAPLPLAISAALADEFSQSDLPWKVDVVDWSATGESFRRIIERHKVLVQRPRDGSDPGR